MIDAFHSSKNFYYEHIRSEDLRLEMGEARQLELSDQARKARDEILRSSDVGSFILSKDALSILAKYEAESENAPRRESWYEYLDSSWSLTNRYMKDFILAAHADLGNRT